MKNMFGFLIIIFSISSQVYSQWYPQNSGTNEELWHVNFITENVGWASSNYKIYKTTDGGINWFVQKDLYPERVIKFQFLNENSGWYIGTYTGTETNIRKTTDGGETWNLMVALSEAYLRDMIFINDTLGWCVGEGVFPITIKTTDGGSTWEEIIISQTYFEGLNSVFFLNESEGWIAGFENIFRTSDGGITWTELPYASGGVSALKLQFLSSNIGWSTDGGRLLKTIDGGLEWLQQSGVWSVNFYFCNLDTGWSVYADSILYTTDGGNNWVGQNSGTDNFLWDLSFIGFNRGWVVGNSGIILYTINGGTPVEFLTFNANMVENNIILGWITATETNNKGFEIEKRKVNNLKSSVLNWYRVGFVEGNGTTSDEHSYLYKDKDLIPGKYYYRLKQIDFDGSYNYSKEIEVEVTTPSKISLEQNYPNPFNPFTTIEYSIPDNDNENELVSLKIFNSLGEEVSVLVKEYKSAGNYKIKFDGSKLPSGVYFYRLTAGNHNLTKKLMLMK